MGYFSGLDEFLTRDVLVRSIRAPADLACVRLVCKRWLSETRSARLEVLLEGRRVDWCVALRGLLKAAPRLVALRLFRTNATEEDLALALEGEAQHLEAVTVSKSFRIVNFFAEPRLVQMAAERTFLGTLHVGDANARLPDDYDPRGSPHRFLRPALMGLRVVGLTNSCLDSDLLAELLTYAKNLQVLFLGGCQIVVVASRCSSSSAAPPPTPADKEEDDGQVEEEEEEEKRTSLLVETTAMSASCRERVLAEVSKHRLFEEVDFSKTSINKLEQCFLSNNNLALAAATEASDMRKLSALHAAAMANDEVRVDFLVRAGADAAARDLTGATALLRAAETGALASINVLLRRAAREQPHHEHLGWGDLLSIPNYRYETALNVAAVRGHVECVLSILGFERAQSPGTTTTAILALRADKEHFTALHAAIVGRHAGVLRVLLAELKKDSSNIGVDAANRYGQTCLHLAARAGDPELATLLLEAGAKLNEKDERGWTPLDVALAGEKKTRARGRECAERLKTAGATASNSFALRRRPNRRPQHQQQQQ